MKAKLTQGKFRFALGRVGQLFSLVVWLGAVILICSSASAQNMFVSGTDAGGGEVFKFPLAGPETIFATGLVDPWDLAFDRAGNLFVVDSQCGELYCGAKINKITPQGVRTVLASGSSMNTSRTGHEPPLPPDCTALWVWLWTARATCL